MTASEPGAPDSVAIGIDVGGTKVLGVAISATGRVLAEQRVPTPEGAGDLLRAVGEVVRSLDDSLPGPDATVPVGVGAPGLVDRSGAVRFAPNLPGALGLDLHAGMLEVLGRHRPVAVDNDATCAGWGEATFGAAVGASHAVIVTLGTGIGGGLVVDGKVLHGAHGFAGEIGHMVVDPSGPVCPCGRQGCWERYASGSGLGWLGREAVAAGSGARLLELAGGDPAGVRGEHVTRAAGEGDPDALAVTGRFAWWLASGLANLANVLDPQVIVIAGGLVEAGEVLMAPTRREFSLLVEAGALRPDIHIVPAVLGERAGAIGAAALALAEAPRGGRW